MRLVTFFLIFTLILGGIITAQYENVDFKAASGTSLVTDGKPVVSFSTNISFFDNLQFSNGTLWLIAPQWDNISDCGKLEILLNITFLRENITKTINETVANVSYIFIINSSTALVENQSYFIQMTNFTLQKIIMVFNRFTEWIILKPIFYINETTEEPTPQEPLNNTNPLPTNNSSEETNAEPEASNTNSMQELNNDMITGVSATALIGIVVLTLLKTVKKED